jgi:hypothetical protein
MIFIILLIIFFVSYFCFSKDKVTKKKCFDLEKDGFVIFQNVLKREEVEHLNSLCQGKQYQLIQEYLSFHPEIVNNIRSKLDDSYVFQDYIWIIEKSAVHTCHRDNNGDFFNRNQKNPSYTMLVYLEDMPKALGVIPQSHKFKNSFGINVFDPLTHLCVKKGDAILFNANLIHVGTINKKDDHLRIQMKVTHKDDLEAIGYYENFHKILTKSNKNPKWIRKAQKRLSCMFPLISDYVQNENIRSARGSDNGVKIGIGQKIFSKLYYGDSSFYDLPNAF